MKGKHTAIPWLLVGILLVATIILHQEPAWGRQLPRLSDQAGLLNPTQAQHLTQMLDEISEKHSFDTVVVTIPRLDYREPRLYAADFFEENGFGYGPNLDGAILLLAIETRDLGFAALGLGVTIFTPAAQDYLDSLILPDLGQDHYFEALTIFARAVDDILNQFSQDTYDKSREISTTYHSYNTTSSYNAPTAYSPYSPAKALTTQRRMYAIWGSLIAAFLIALITTLIWRGQLKSIKAQGMAHAYIQENSLALRKSSDIFLYRRTQRIKMQRQQSQPTHKGGGSFKTSSGRSATGHNRKF